MKHFYSPSFSFALLFLYICLLSGCNIFSSDDDGLTISGTVTAPAGVDISGAEIVACFGGDADSDPTLACDFSSPNTQIILIESSGTTASFKFKDLTEGDYWIRAVIFDDDHWTAFRGDNCNRGRDGTCHYIAPSAEEVDIILEPVENDFRVRVTGPDGFDLTGGEVAFCIPHETEDDVCDEERSSRAILLLPPREPERPFFGLQVWPFPAGNYVLLAGKDTDGDRVWDFWNCYATFASYPNCAEVSPGSGLVYDIQISETSNPPPPPYGAAVIANGKKRANSYKPAPHIVKSRLRN